MTPTIGGNDVGFADVFHQVRSLAPSAKVAVASQPHPFNGEDSNLATTSAGGLTQVEVRPAFHDHAVCDDVEEINGPGNPVEESPHPSRLGNEGYAAAIAPSLTAPPGAARAGGNRSPRRSAPADGA